MHVLIVGGGIGGLTLAVALAQKGHVTRVLERSRTLAPAGAGLALQPNAMTVLAALGLAGAVVAAGQKVARAAILDRSGRALGAEVDMTSLGARFGAPIVAIHRARLHGVLRDVVGEAALTLGTEVVQVDSSVSGATVRCQDGQSFEADVVVGADGLHSTIRRQLLDDGEPVYSGYTSWRGVTKAGAGPKLTRMTESWGAGERFGMVDIGHGEIYWFAVADAPHDARDRNAPVELLERFAGWHEPVRAVLEATAPDRIIRTDISDRDPVTRWHSGRVVLLGDAAHPMTPNLGQGACQAIEDAAVLADELSRSADTGQTLVNYERRRVTRANGIVMRARRLGQIAQWRHPIAVRARNALMRLTPRAAAEKQVRDLWRV
ncbi:MAG: FAD-dependent monooxygenase [Vicinamibacterales bacterium]